MRIRGFFIFLIILLTVIVVVLLGDFGKPRNSEVAALVNGEPITFGDVRNQAQEANRQFEFLIRFNLNDEPFPEELPAEYLQFVREMGYDPDELTKYQHQFIHGHLSTYWDMHGQLTPLSEDEKRLIHRQLRWVVRRLDYLEFNELVRQRVLYQDAVRNGHQVSVDEARQMQKESDELSQSMLDREGEPEGYLEYMKLEKEIYGYHSRGQWQESRLPQKAESASISRLQQRFNDKLGLQHPDIYGWDFARFSENAWEDYTEYLVRQADIEIRKGGFELEFFGEEWPHGRWDLREKDEVIQPPPVRQRAMLSLDQNHLAAEADQIVTVLRKRLEHLGASDIDIRVQNREIGIQAVWYDTISWEVLGKQGLIQIGDDEDPITNEHLAEAKFTKEMSLNTPMISLDIGLTEAGAQLLERLTTENMGRQVPFLLDGEVLFSPTVQTPITEGRLRLTLPNWSENETHALATVLSSDTLPQAVTITAAD